VEWGGIAPRVVQAVSQRECLHSIMRGVWVVSQHDECVCCDAHAVQVAGLSLDGVTPFQAASLIAGPDEVAESTPVGLVVSEHKTFL
jgi:hypothetical protein